MSNPIFTSLILILHHNRKKIIVGGLLLVVIALGAFLRFYQLGDSGVGNTYYAAAVKSMLLSWKNFFFVASEPGGSLGVDKPPLGFWVQAISAYFLGVTGFALALPNAIAGVLSIFVIYKLVRYPFGPWIGLVAALVLAVTPVAISTERNNTIDGLLVFVLLLAAWAFLHSVYSTRLRWLLLGAILIGLGFNIKMLQAFLPVPAFYALYFFGARQSCGKKILHLAAATAMLVIVSLSWAMAVDLTPASERPYVDSTNTNTVMELIAGHNGLERQGFGAVGGQLVPLKGIQLGSSDGSVDFGKAGTWRLFTAPLAGEVSWLLPFVLGGLLLLVALLWKQPFGNAHIALILWAGWLLPEMFFFTYGTGLLHVYYLIMLGAPLAALTAMTVWAFGEVIKERSLFGWGLLSMLAIATLVFQGVIVWREVARAIWALVIAGVFCGSGLLLAAMGRPRTRFVAAALALELIALLLAPATWSALTTFNPSPDSVLPYAGPNRHPGSSPTVKSHEISQNNANLGYDSVGDSQILLNYLLANTKPGTYLLATGRISRASSYILETGRPVLTFGGYVGQYEVVTVDQVEILVKNGQLRFVLDEGLDQHQALAQWVQQNCSVVESSKLVGITALRSATSGKGSNDVSLYDCKK